MAIEMLRYQPSPNGLKVWVHGTHIGYIREGLQQRHFFQPSETTEELWLGWELLTELAVKIKGMEYSSQLPAPKQEPKQVEHKQDG